MQPSVQITPYRPEFRDRLVDLWRASFAHGVGVPVPHPIDDHRRFFDEHMRVETRVHVALSDDALVGFICFTQLAEGLAMLTQATGDASYAVAARQIVPLLQPRGVQHSHGYLSTLRGAVLLHEAGGDPAMLAFAETWVLAEYPALSLPPGPDRDSL